MPLTTRTNGSLSANIITASWFNDFKDLLTGVMTDQEVTVKNNLVLKALGQSPTVAPTGAIAAGAGLGIGNYQYTYSFVSPDGESFQSPTSAIITTTSGNQKINVSGIAVGSTGTTARNVYRTAVGGTVFKILTTINDNTSTTLADTTADGSLGATGPFSNTFGGSLIVKDYLGANRLRLTNVDGGGSGRVEAYGIEGDAAILSATALTLNDTSGGFLSLIPDNNPIAGSSAGTVTLWQPLNGDVKLTIITEDSYNSTQKDLVLFTPYTKRAMIFTSDIGVSANGGMQLLNVTIAQNFNIITTLAAAGGTTAAVQTSLFANSIGFCYNPFDTVRMLATTGVHSGTIFIVGV